MSSIHQMFAKRLLARIREIDEHTSRGKCADWPDYKARTARAGGLREAYELYQECAKEYRVGDFPDEDEP